MRKIKRKLMLFVAALMTLGLVGCDVNVQIDGGSNDLLESLLGGSSESVDGEITSEEGTSLEEGSTEGESSSEENSSTEEAPADPAGSDEGEAGETENSSTDENSSEGTDVSSSEEMDSGSTEENSSVGTDSSDSNEEDSSEEEKETKLQFTIVEIEGTKYACVSGITMGEETEIIIPATYEGHPVAIIGEGAFRGSGVTLVDLGENMIAIAPYAFADCKDLVAVGAHLALQAVGENAFSGCENLKEVHYKGTEQEINEIQIEKGNDVLFSAELYCYGEEEEEEEDPPVVEQPKTYIRVKNFNGGYGSEWLQEAVARFEAIYADTSFEVGKKGVSVMIDNNRNNQIATYDSYDVYITQSVQYRDLAASGRLLDITEAVVSENYYDGSHKSVENRMTAQQKQYYQVDGKYYAIPNYSTAMGLTYNISLFEERGYYFIDGYDISSGEDCFVRSDTDKRSVGPDGQYGTMDDGLPTTYEEFFMLCDYIAMHGDIPMTWAGAYADQYVGNLFASMVANDLGMEQMMLFYTMEGEANSVGSLDASGNFIVEPMTIAPQNAFELYRRVEQYQALKFFETFLGNRNYYSQSAMMSYANHIDAQREFLLSKFKSSSEAVAMLVEGIWWENEAEETFEQIEQKYGWDAADESRRLGWMPLPRSDESKIGQKNVYMDTYNSIMCADAGVASDEKRTLVMEFLKFLNSEQELANFTMKTSAPKALSYSLTDEQYMQLTPFGQSVWTYRENADVMMAEDIVVGTNVISSSYMYSCAGYSSPISALMNNRMSAEEYFNEMYAYHRQMWQEQTW